MPQVETILAEAVAPGQQVAIAAPGIRYGTIERGSATVTVGGFPQPDAAFAVDLLAETIHIRNGGTDPWAAGAKLVVTWEGTLASGPPSAPGGGDPALEARITALETTTSTHEYQLQGHESRISQNYNRINDLAGRVDILEQRIAALEAKP